MYPTSTLPTLPLEAVATVGFLILAAAFCVFSAVLYYHFDAYSTDAVVTRLTLVSFFVITTPLLIIMGIMTLII